MSDNQELKQTSTQRSSAVYAWSLVVLLLAGAGVAWKMGAIEFRSANALEAESTVTGIETDDINIIEECTDDSSTALLEKILAQGIPELVKNSSPNATLTIQNYAYNQELYFDPNRNKRLCGVLAQYKVEGPNIPTDVENPSIVYEVIYELQKEPDQSIKLSTFRQRITSSNLQGEKPTNIEQN